MRTIVLAVGVIALGVTGVLAAAALRLTGASSPGTKWRHSCLASR